MSFPIRFGSFSLLTCVVPLVMGGCVEEDAADHESARSDQEADGGAREDEDPSGQASDASVAEGRDNAQGSADDVQADDRSESDSPGADDPAADEPRRDDPASDESASDESNVGADDGSEPNDDSAGDGTAHSNSDGGAATEGDSTAGDPRGDAGSDPTTTQPEAALDGVDGIAVTADGTAYVCTTNVGIDEYGTTYPAMGIFALCDTDEWHVAFPKEPGTYPCAKWNPADGAAYQNEEQAYIYHSPNMSGVFGSDPENGGVCSVTVKRTKGSVQGTFSGTLVSVLGELMTLEDGSFFYTDGLGDCALANDPGLQAVEYGATVAVNNIEGKTKTLKCGQNFKLTDTTTNYDGIYFVGLNGDREIRFSIEGLTTAGTFACGAPGNPDDPDSRAVTLGLGNGVLGFYYQQCLDTCTVDVTRYDDVIEGTYTATLRESCSNDAAVAGLNGTFRASATPKFPGTL